MPLRSLSFEGLSNIELAYSPITPAGCDALGARLRDPQDVPVLSIDLTSNELGPIQTEHLVFALTKCVSLREVAIRFNNIGELGCAALGELCTHPRVESFDVRGNRLTLRDMRTFLSSISRHNALKRLCVAFNDIGIDGAAMIAREFAAHPGLVHLDLTSTNLGERGAGEIAKLLRSPHTTLEVLVLGFNHLGAAGTRALAEGVAQSRTLRRLSMVSNAMSDESAEELSAAIASAPSLTSVDLSNNMITHDGMAHIAALGTKLTCLQLGYNHLSVAGIERFVRRMGVPIALQRLDLWHTHIGDDGVAYVAALITNSELRELILAQNGIGDQGAIEIAAALLRSTTLVILDLTSNTIAKAGATALIDAVQRNEKVRGMSLVGNPLSRLILKRLEALLDERKQVSA